MSSIERLAAPLAVREPPLLVEGRTCWRIAVSRRVAFLVDSASYFAALALALKQARRSILIVAWDFDGDISLQPDGTTGAKPGTLRQLLSDLADSRPELQIRVLIWGASVFYAPSAVSSALHQAFQSHPRIRFKFDGRHPLGAAHHQKAVCIDDALAFVGGIDLTVQRWDTSEHLADDPRRVDPRGRPYPPVHDMQMAVDGDAAKAIAALARDRWEQATGERLPPVEDAGDLWPEALVPALREVPVGIARTRPPTSVAAGAREVERLTMEALASARRWVYIEAQYFSSFDVADLLARRLQEEDGPEIVAVVRRGSRGWLERFIMAGNRDRVLRRLHAADRHGRFRACYPVVPGDPEQDVSIHAKLLMVDGRFVKIGSSNFNNRSMGLDSECDLAIEAEDEATARAILALRTRLLAEHLGASPEAVEAAAARTGSLIAAIDRLSTGPRRLRTLLPDPLEGPTDPLPGNSILDPKEPIGLRRLWRG